MGASLTWQYNGVTKAIGCKAHGSGRMTMSPLQEVQTNLHASSRGHLE